MKADFLLYRPPETFAAIGIAADRVSQSQITNVTAVDGSGGHGLSCARQVMMRYEAHEALRRDTITMLRRKRQQLAAKAQQKLMQEQEQQSPTAAHKDEESEVCQQLFSTSYHGWPECSRRRMMTCDP